MATEKILAMETSIWKIRRKKKRKNIYFRYFNKNIWISNLSISTMDFHCKAGLGSKFRITVMIWEQRFADNAETRQPLSINKALLTWIYWMRQVWLLHCFQMSVLETYRPIITKETHFVGFSITKWNFLQNQFIFLATVWCKIFSLINRNYGQMN